MTVDTENPFIVRNNLAQLEATGTLRVRGDMDEPAPFGRLEIRPGGKVFLQERGVHGRRAAASSTTARWTPTIDDARADLIAQRGRAGHRGHGRRPRARCDAGS